jgi:nucleoside-diphosphate-sugar epimerase
VKTLAVIGGNGFVGSAFVRQGPAAGFEVTSISRDNYASSVGRGFDVVVDAAANSRKYLADENPLEDFRLSVEHRLRTLLDFQAGIHLHVSSVDVYEDLTSPETTREDRVINASRTSRYGFHKLLAEQLVRHYAKEWLIVRLAGMVGPGLRKNPVYDILHDQPLRIHPDSRYQFMATDEAARMSLSLVKEGGLMEIFNICGRGLISPREIASIADRPLRVEGPDLRVLSPRIVEASTEKLDARGEGVESRKSVSGYLAAAETRAAQQGPAVRQALDGQ